MRLRYIYLIMLGLLVTSCFDDETTLDQVTLSEITIDTLKLQKVYNIDKNTTLEITPQVSQSLENQELTFEWQADYKVYSDSSSLRFAGKELGTYPMRLKVSNTHGSAFYEFTIHVNSPYEEGIAVLSAAPDGSSLLSFMRKYSKEELEAGAVEHFATNCLEINNPGVTFAKGPSDMGKRLSQIYLTCKDEPTVYALNAKTFEIENIITTPEYPDFSPVALQLTDNDARSAIIVSEDGSFYDLSTFEGVLVPHTLLTSTYAPAYSIYYNDYSVINHFWNYELSTICAYGGGEELNLGDEYFFWDHEPIAIFNNIYGDNFILLTKYDGQYISTTIGIMLYEFIYDEDWTLIEQRPDIRDQRLIEGNPVLTLNTPKVANTKYKSLIYAQGNKLYRWYFSDDSFSTDYWASIDLDGAEITSLSLSPDEEELYVGVCQPGKEGLNGHLHILNSDTGKSVKGSPYSNIAYQPIKILYKTK